MLLKLHTFGLVRGGFRPTVAIVTLESERTVLDALSGSDTSADLFELEQALHLYDTLVELIDRCDQRCVALLAELTEVFEAGVLVRPSRQLPNSPGSTSA